jgi:oligosaccharide repeat unit polymerase
MFAETVTRRVRSGGSISVRPLLGLIGSLMLALVAYAAETSILSFSGVYVALAAVPFVVRKSALNTDVFRPFTGLAALLYLYSISTPLFISATNGTYWGEVVDAGDLATYYFACVAAIAGLSLGTVLASHADRRYGTPVIPTVTDQYQRRLLVVAALVAGILGLPFIVGKFDPTAATSYGDVALSLRVDRLADKSSGPKEILFEIIPSTIVLCAATSILFDSYRRFVLRILAGSLIALYWITSILSGWRGQLMVAILIVGIFFHYRVRAFRWTNMFIGAVLIYVLINGLSVVRASSNPVEMFAALLSAIDDRGFQFLAIEQSGELATSTNLITLIHGIETGKTQYGLGSIALGQIAAFLPRAVLADRPDFGSELFVKTFYPGVFESGGGYGFFVVQDGYWDFGLLGVVFYCALFAYFIERLYRALSHRFHMDLVVFLYALLYSQLVLSLVRSGIFAAIKGALIVASPMLLLLVLSRAIRFRVGSKQNTLQNSIR